ncbi:MAG: histone deacetylase, partial [Myxococcota bacterium]
NNVAVAARYAQEKHGLSRLLIIDWDVHHGNGTQAIFWRDPTVAYFSIHQYPFYPGTGAAREDGEAEGKGFTVNCPQPGGAGDAALGAALDEKLVPLWERIDPQMIIVSAGYDAHDRDSLAQLTVSTAGFSRMARWILERAGKHPVAFVLEGGYDETALSECTVETARACLDTLPF